MRKAVVTGATGFIGCHLVEELQKENVEVYALCRKNSLNAGRLSDAQNCHIIYIESWDGDDIVQQFDKKEIDVFYHLAWEGASGEQRKDFAVQLQNIIFTCKMIEVASRLKCKKFVCTGTICENQVYDIMSQNKFVTASYYLMAKQTAYCFSQNKCKELGIKLIWCTFYHPIGKYNKREQLIANTIYKMLSGGALKFGTAKGWFDIVAIEDLCKGLYLAGKCELCNDRYFIGSGSPQTLYCYLEEIKEIINPNAYMQYGSLATDDIEMKKEWLDIDAFQTETGYTPQYSLYDAVCETRDWVIYDMRR